MRSTLKRVNLNALTVSLVLLATGSTVAQCPLAKLTAPDGRSGAMFGSSVAMDGDRLIVSAPCNSNHGHCTGSVYVFHRTGPAWMLEAQLFARIPRRESRVGTSLDIHGNQIAIGAPTYHSVLIFGNAHGIWREEAEMTPDHFWLSRFGESVAIEDSLLCGLADGRRAIFRRSGTEWFREGLPRHPYGVKAVAVAMAEGIVFVAYAVASPGGVDGVKVYQNDADDWIRTHEIDTPLNDRSVIVAGRDVFAVSAPVNSAASPVRTFLYNGDWIEAAELSPTDPVTASDFGAALAIAGEYLLVGAPGDDAAYVFGKDAQQWSQNAKLTPFDGAESSRFGASVAISDKMAIVGAPLDDSIGQDAGAVYVFGVGSDCNSNGLVDTCEIANDSSPDCGGNLVPSECEPDCNENGQADDCDILNQIATDCNSNGIPDACDSTTDSDSDGFEDCLDGCPLDPLKDAPGLCDCGTPDDDIDGDGIPDCLDLCPYDREKSDPGVCGCDEDDADEDGDGHPDCAAIINIVPVSADGAHQISGNDITVTSDTSTVTAEIFASNWSPEGELLRSYQIDIDDSYFIQGDSGRVRILDARRPCQWDAECIDLGVECFNGFCNELIRPNLGATLEHWRIDFVFAGRLNFGAIDYSTPGIIRIGSVLWSDSYAYFPPPRYMGTISLRLSSDATGTFTVGLNPYGSDNSTGVVLTDKEYGVINSFVVRPALIHVLTPQCGNGLCELSEDEISCRIDCVPGALPAVSFWGLSVLALVMLAGARIGFRRRRNC